MSIVTSIVLTCSILEDAGSEDVFPAIDYINSYLSDACKGTLAYLNGHEGGFKAWQIHVFGGAFNYLDWDEFTGVVATAPWVEIDCATLLVNEEQENGCRAVGVASLKPSNDPDA